MKNKKVKKNDDARKPAAAETEVLNDAKKPGKGKLLWPKSGKGLALRIVIFLLIPYAFLWICGFVFDRWLRWYFMTTYIFIALCALYALALVGIVFLVLHYRKRSR